MGWKKAVQACHHRSLKAIPGFLKAIKSPENVFNQDPCSVTANQRVFYQPTGLQRLDSFHANTVCEMGKANRKWLFHGCANPKDRAPGWALGWANLSGSQEA